MQETDAHSDSPSDVEAEHGAGSPRPVRNRLAVVLAFLLVVLVLVFIPPLINVSRFQRSVDRNISAALGRPVHFDRLSLTLLPMPGFTLQGVVIDEDPAFGSEPTLRADEVQVNLRLSSLWRHRVEFSKISLTDPSVNLVHLADGRWNIESLLLQASRIPAAPTAQRFAGPAPRFPYIEATGARLNLKLGQEKTPFSLTDADFALWLPEPQQWHLRLEAHPIRTDTNPGDTGILRMEGTLGAGGPQGTGTLAAGFVDSLAQVPIDLRGQWRDAQLGGLSRLLFARDEGLRGDVSVGFSIRGSIAMNAIATDIVLANARRADFIPPRPLSLEAACNAVARNAFHSFSSIECSWPPAYSSDPNILIVAARLPDVDHPESCSGQITLPALPADTFFNWLSIAARHPPTGLANSSGTLAGVLSWGANPSSAGNQPTWFGELEFSGGSVAIGSPDHHPIPLGDILLRSTPPPAAPAPHSHRQSKAPLDVPPDSFDLLPISLDLGGKEPAILEGRLDATGYTLHLTGSAIPARIVALGDAIPQLGDGLENCLQSPPDAPSSDSGDAHATPRGSVRRFRGSPALPDSLPSESPADSQPELPIHIDFTAIRAWGHPQNWCQAEPNPPHPHAGK
jgi:AsmA protein